MKKKRQTLANPTNPPVGRWYMRHVTSALINPGFMSNSSSSFHIRPNNTVCLFFFSSRSRHTRCYRDWSSDVCSSDLVGRLRLHLRGHPLPVKHRHRLRSPADGEAAEDGAADLGFAPEGAGLLEERGGAHAGGEDEDRAVLAGHPVEQPGDLPRRRPPFLPQRGGANGDAAAAPHHLRQLLGQPGFEQRDAPALQALLHAASRLPSETPARQASSSSRTRGRQLPQPVPARVAAQTASSDPHPDFAAAASAPLETPLQSQMRASSGRSATRMGTAPSWSWKRSAARLSGSGMPRSNDWSSAAAGAVSPSSTAPARRPSRTTSFLYTPRAGSAKVISSSRSPAPCDRPMTDSSTPITLSRVARRDPTYIAFGRAPERRSARMRACSQAGATRP